MSFERRERKDEINIYLSLSPIFVFQQILSARGREAERERESRRNGPSTNQKREKLLIWRLAGGRVSIFTKVEKMREDESASEFFEEREKRGQNIKAGFYETKTASFKNELVVESRC